MWRLKKSLALFLCFLYAATFPLLTLAADSAPTTQFVQLLQKYKTYRARFVQTTFQPDGSRPQMSSGWMMMQRPGQFRWEIRKPMRQIIIANGNDLWVYDVALQQVTHQKVSAGVSSPAYLLSGDVKQLAKQYQITQVKKLGKLWFQLKPRAKNVDFVVIQMYFSRGRLTAMWVKNNLGVISQFAFHDIHLNKPLEPSLFQFTPPPGVDVLS